MTGACFLLPGSSKYLIPPPFFCSIRFFLRTRTTGPVPLNMSVCVSCQKTKRLPFICPGERDSVFFFLFVVAVGNGSMLCILDSIKGRL